MIDPLHRNPTQITKDRVSHVMAFPGQATIDDEVRESGSTLIARIIIL